MSPSDVVSYEFYRNSNYRAFRHVLEYSNLIVVARGSESAWRFFCHSASISDKFASVQYSMTPFQQKMARSIRLSSFFFRQFVPFTL